MWTLHVATLFALVGARSTGSPGGFSQTMLDTVVHAERRLGCYDITLASVCVVEALTARVVASSSSKVVLEAIPQANVEILRSQICNMVQGVADVLTDFNTFRNERLADKCQIGTVVLRTVTRVLGATPSGEPDDGDQHRTREVGGRGEDTLAAHLRTVLQWDLHTSLTGRALLRVLAKGHAEIDALVYVHRHDVRAREWIQLVDLAFDALIAVLSAGVPEAPPASGTVPGRTVRSAGATRDGGVAGLSELQRELLGEVEGAGGDGRNMVTDIASYLKHTRSTTLPVKAARTLMLICRFAGNQSVAACLGPSPGLSHYQGISQQEMLQVAVAKRLEEKAQKSPWQLRVAILDCVREAVLTQPGLTKLFLDMRDPSTTKSSADSSAKSSTADGGTSTQRKRRRVLGDNSCMHEVLRVLKDQVSGGWLASHPQVPAAATRLVHALWTMNTTSVLRSSPDFWSSFLQPLKFNKQAPDALATAAEFATWHHQTLAQASVLEVLTLEAYATMGKIAEQSDGPNTAVAALCRDDGTVSVTRTCYSPWSWWFRGGPGVLPREELVLYCFRVHSVVLGEVVFLGARVGRTRRRVFAVAVRM
eukprot:m.1586294 g.1586294  ORF g.1586294 m.1586294 type:complete len:593 (+) comp25327_c0_seq23:3127-4905(+)